MRFYGQSITTGGGSVDPIDNILYDRYFRDNTNGIAIECGANDGLYLSTCLVFEELGWQVYNIEASKNNFHKLQINRPKSFNLFYALSNVNDRQVEIYNYNGDNGGMNGLFNYGDVVARYGQPYTSTCSTITYDKLFGNIDVDLLVLDVEGHEQEALWGINYHNKIPKIICVEHNRCGIETLKRTLSDYRLDFIDGLNAIFVR